MAGKPLHVHDCEDCVYLGTEDGVDFYRHRRGSAMNDEMIAREGSEGHDYRCVTRRTVFRRPEITGWVKVWFKLDRINDPEAYHDLENHVMYRRA